MFARSYADLDVGAGPFAFTVDRNAPAQPQLHVVPDQAAITAGWWGHAPVALSLSTGTAADVVSSRLRVYDPAGALVLDQTSAGALAAASVPASALAASGMYGVDVVECDAAGHCTASARADLRWDGAAAPVPADAPAPPLGSLAARDGAHLTWPPLSAGMAGQRDRRGVHRHRHDSRCRP